VSIKNCEIMSKPGCTIEPASKLIGDILKLMQREGYIGNFEFVDNGKAGIYRVQLLGRINDCRIIKPRYSVRKGGFERWEKRYLPAKGFGTLIVTTPQGLLTHTDAKLQGIGGKLVAFVY
jgi:small subunit ribosomal protein S8